MILNLHHKFGFTNITPDGLLVDYQTTLKIGNTANNETSGHLVTPSRVLWAYGGELQNTDPKNSFLCPSVSN